MAARRHEGRHKHHIDWQALRPRKPCASMCRCGDDPPGSRRAYTARLRHPALGKVNPVRARPHRKLHVVSHDHADPLRTAGGDERANKPLAMARIPVPDDDGRPGWKLPRAGHPVSIDPVISHEDQSTDRAGWRAGIEPARHSCKLLPFPALTVTCHADIHNSIGYRRKHRAYSRAHGTGGG